MSCNFNALLDNFTAMFKWALLTFPIKTFCFKLEDISNHRKDELSHVVRSIITYFYKVEGKNNYPIQERLEQPSSCYANSSIMNANVYKPRRGLLGGVRVE